MTSRAERCFNNSLTYSSKEGTIIWKTGTEKHLLCSNWEDPKRPLGLSGYNKGKCPRYITSGYVVGTGWGTFLISPTVHTSDLPCYQGEKKPRQAPCPMPHSQAQEDSMSVSLDSEVMIFQPPHNTGARGLKSKQWGPSCLRIIHDC